jgi:hypothetical protein
MEEANQSLNDPIELHLMARPAPSDSGKRLGDTKRRESDEVKERESHQRPACSTETPQQGECMYASDPC